MRIHLPKRVLLWTVKRERNQKRSGFPHYSPISIKIVRTHSIDWNRKFRKNFRLEIYSNHLNPFLFEIQTWESLKYLFDWKIMIHIIHIIDYSIGFQWDSKFRDFFYSSKRVAERSIKEFLRFDSSTQLVVFLESTSSPHYEWKGKCKDYH